MNERNNKMITITDLLEKGIKPNGKSLTKKFFWNISKLMKKL